MDISRDTSWDLLCEYTKGEGLRKHALSVEIAMAAYARQFQEDELTWRTVGLLHDFDYEQYPDEHPQKGEPILKAKGYPESVRQAILAHADGTGVPADSRMAKALRAVDELCGLIVAVALVKPNKTLAEVTLKSIKKKWKDKAFARGVNREDVIQATEKLGIPLDDHINFVLQALQEHANVLGL